MSPRAKPCGAIRLFLSCALLCAAALASSGCATLLKPAATQAVSHNYLLEAPAPAGEIGSSGDVVLAVAPPRITAGLDTTNIAYVKERFRLDYYVNNQWVDSPRRMLVPLVINALEQTGRFRSVVNAPSPVSEDVSLETDLLGLQQEFFTTPSQVRLKVRAQLIDMRRRTVLATRIIEAVEPAPSEDAYGGVVAANKALSRVLEELAQFCVGEVSRVPQVRER